jgi:hypothetical protein
MYVLRQSFGRLNRYYLISLACSMNQLTLTQFISRCLTVSTQQRHVAILPAMRIARGDGSSSLSPFQGRICGLSGNASYAVIEYENVMDNESEISSLHGLLRPPVCPW